jgi:hypothetical protein
MGTSMLVTPLDPLCATRAVRARRAHESMQGS